MAEEKFSHLKLKIIVLYLMNRDKLCDLQMFIWQIRRIDLKLILRLVKCWYSSCTKSYVKYNLCYTLWDCTINPMKCRLYQILRRKRQSGHFGCIPGRDRYFHILQYLPYSTLISSLSFFCPRANPAHFARNWFLCWLYLLTGPTSLV